MFRDMATNLSSKVGLGTRLRITIVFALLSTTVCLILGLIVSDLFYKRLNDAMDEELTALSSELSTFVNLLDETSDLDAWQTSKSRSELKSVVSISLFNEEGKTIETYGDFVLPRVAKNHSETKVRGQQVRVLSRKLQYRGKLIGWLQITKFTASRDRAMSELLNLMELSTPVLILGFMGVGYFFAGWCVRPIEEAFSVVKRFMIDAGHELKTPLTIAETHSEALEQELIDQEISTKRLNTVRSSLKRMEHLIDDLMLLARSEAPVFLKLDHSIDLNQLVHSVVEDFSEKSKAKGIDLRCDFTAPVQIHGDQEYLRRALSNLMENAWRYTESGGSVVVSGTKSADEAVITITDSGIGIPHEALPYLFDRFYRVESSRSRKDGGSGLGLSIVQTIIEAHHGRVFVHSELGRGSRFTIKLPTF